jgi:hypothetical protein
MATPAAAPSRHPSFASRLLKALDRYKPLLALAGCIISFLAGYGYKFYADSEARQDKAAQDWRTALDKINLDGSNQLNDALLMQTFESNRQYAQRARQLEVAILGRMSDPEAFDSVYFALQNKSTQDEVGDLEELDRVLARQTRALMSYAEFPPAELNLSPGPRLQRFLLNPARYLSDRTRIYRAEALIWELDSVSGGLHCLWTRGPGCPSLRPSGNEDPEMILVNNDFSGVFPGPGKQPTLLNTCAVHALHGIDRQVQMACTSDAP